MVLLFIAGLARAQQLRGGTSQDVPPGVSAKAGRQKGQDEVTPSGSPLGAQLEKGRYTQLTPKQRFEWFLKSTIGPRDLTAGIFSAGIATAGNVPDEDGPGWDGFGKRYGLRLSTLALQRAMEGSMGAAIGTDPRYFRVPDEKFSDRVRSVVKQTFLARRPDGTFGLAYDRFISYPTSSFISNKWRPGSDASGSEATLRVSYGFEWRMAENAIKEFWPNAEPHLPWFRHHPHNP